MKNQQKQFEEDLERVVRMIVESIRKHSHEEEARLIAICKNESPNDFEMAKMFEDMKTVTLGASFNELSTYDKLLVAKATINAHLQFTSGLIAPFGKIVYYELEDNSPTYRAFNLDGEYMSIFK